MRPVLVTVAALLALAAPAPARAAQNDYVVAPAGTGTACTSAAPCSLAFAVGAANGNGTADYDYLHLGPGTYTDPIAITAGNVTLQGYQSELRAAATTAVVRVDPGADQNVALLDLTVTGTEQSADASAAVEVAGGTLQMQRDTLSMRHDAPNTVAFRVSGGSGSFGSAFNGERARITVDTPQPAAVVTGGHLTLSGTDIKRSVPSTQPLVRTRFGLDLDSSTLTAAGNAGPLVAVDDTAATPGYPPTVRVVSAALSGGDTSLSVTGPAQLYLRHLTERGAAHALVLDPGTGAISGELRDSIVRDPVTLGGATLQCSNDDIAPGTCPAGSDGNAFTASETDLLEAGSLRPRPGGPAIDTGAAPIAGPVLIGGADAAGDPREAPGTCDGTARRDRGAYEFQGGRQSVVVNAPSSLPARQPATLQYVAAPRRTDDAVTWDFGDGATSTDAMPTHAWAGAGSYTITLTHRNAVSGCVVTLTRGVTVTPPAVAVTATPAPGQTPTPTPTPTKTKPKLTTYLRLPAAKACRRSVQVKLRTRKGVTSLRVQIGHGRTRTVKGALRVPVRTKRVRIRVTVVLAGGTRLVVTRTYHRCRG